MLLVDNGQPPRQLLDSSTRCNRAIDHVNIAATVATVVWVVQQHFDSSTTKHGNVGC